MAATTPTTVRTATAAARPTGWRSASGCQKSRRMPVRLFALLFAFAFSAANAQTFPSKTVRLVSGVTPGSASDTMARILAEKMTVALGQPVIVENRLGAGGVVAAKYVASAEPDGHLISIYTSAFTVAPLLNPGTIDPKELTAVATLAEVPTTLELGYPNSDYNFWIGALVAAKTPRDIIQRLHREFNAALAQPDVQDRMKKLGVDPLQLSLEQFEAMISKELEDNARLIKVAGITPN